MFKFSIDGRVWTEITEQSLIIANLLPHWVQEIKDGSKTNPRIWWNIFNRDEKKVAELKAEFACHYKGDDLASFFEMPEQEEINSIDLIKKYNPDYSKKKDTYFSLLRQTEDYEFYKTPDPVRILAVSLFDSAVMEIWKPTANCKRCGKNVSAEAIDNFIKENDA